MPREISALEEIEQYFHCKLCMETLPLATSPCDHARFAVGFTSIGLQVWCTRHNVNIVHIDFEGQEHPSNANRAAPLDGPKFPPLRLIEGGKDADTN